MNIRALTGFVDPGWPLEARRIADVAACLRTAKARLEEAGYPVQTLRLATPPPSEMNRPVRAADRPEVARQPEGHSRHLPNLARRLCQPALRRPGQRSSRDAVLPGGLPPRRRHGYRRRHRGRRTGGRRAARGFLDRGRPPPPRGG